MNSYVVVACLSDKRWFDLDAVRTEPGPVGGSATPGPRKDTGSRQDDGRHHITAMPGTKNEAAGQLSMFADEAS